MNITTWLVILILFLPLDSEAQGYELDKNKNFRILKKIPISGGQAQVLVHGGGHTAGQPFQVELRIFCFEPQSDEKPPHVVHWPVRDSFAVCHLDPGSLKVNSQATAVALKIKHADLDSYYDKLAQGDVKAQIECAKETTIKSFSLVNLCS